MLVRIAEDCSGGRSGVCESACTRRSAPDEGLPLAGRKRLHVFFSKNLGVSLEPTLDFVTPSNAFASLLTKTLGVDRSNPCGPLSRNYACVSLGNVATCLLAKTRRRSPTNPPRTPGPSSDLPASGALAAMDNVGGDPRLSSAPRDQNTRIFFQAPSQGTSPNFFDGAKGSRASGWTVARAACRADRDPAESVVQSLPPLQVTAAPLSLVARSLVLNVGVTRYETRSSQTRSRDWSRHRSGRKTTGAGAFRPEAGDVSQCGRPGHYPGFSQGCSRTHRQRSHDQRLRGP